MLSIIIPYYNKSKYFSKTLNSISLAKERFSSFKFEVVIIDDGSEVVEREKLDNIIEYFTDLNITLLSKPNGGVSSARNVGIRNASFEYLYFLDADDLIHVDFFSKINRTVNAIKDENISGVIYNLKINNKIIKHDHKGNIRFNENIFRDLLFSRSLHLSNLLIRNKSSNRFDEEIHVGEDLQFIFNSLIDCDVSFNEDTISTYVYDGKFHFSKINGIERVYQESKDEKLKRYLLRCINERNYLENKFYKSTKSVNTSNVSRKIKLIGFAKSKLLYMLIQRLRFLI